MDIKIGATLHNRFDIEVKDTITGEIVQRAVAENVVLDQIWRVYTGVNANARLGFRLHYGRGTGTISPTRTALFSQIANTPYPTVVERVYNVPPVESYVKFKQVIAPETSVGETITEVGLGTYDYLMTHALLEDSEGNPISIGPKTDTQEITIYSTIYASISAADSGMAIVVTSGQKNVLLDVMLGQESADKRIGSANVALALSSNKTPTNPTTSYAGEVDPTVTAKFTIHDAGNKKISTARLRYGTSKHNKKIWSIAVSCQFTSWPNYPGDLCRILMPCDAWPGYNFIGKAIGTGNGSTVAFNLPWSDINTSKTYKIYVDSVEKTEGVDYTLSNSEATTTVTFTTAPESGAAITGDWWVNYIPKDSDHVLDLTFSIQYGSV